MSDEARRILDVPVPPADHDDRAQRAVYRNIRTRFHALCDLLDPSVLPKNRRLEAVDFEREVARRSAAKPEDERTLRYERLEWFINQLLETSVQHLPRQHLRTWDGSLAVDATPIPTFARAERRHGGDVVTRSADPDAAWYTRTTDDDDGELRVKKAIWAYEATLAVSGDVQRSPDAVPFPSLVMGMAVLHRPATEPGANAVRALTRVQEHGHPAGFVAGDRAYSNSTPDTYQLPTRALGYKPVHDYKVTQLGVQDEVHGLIQVEGQWYCQAMPDVLVNATKDFREGRIPLAVYQQRLEARVSFRARPKGKPDAEGHQQLLCPASSGAPTACCPLKPASQVFNAKALRTVRPSPSMIDNPPKVCRQQSVTIHPEAGAKLAQPLVFGSEEHSRVYQTLRSSIEGMNGYVKDAAYEGVAQAQRRRIRGVAASSILVAFQLVGANLRKIDGFLESVRKAATGLFRRPRPRRRSTRPLSDWAPSMMAGDSGGPSPPD